MKRQPVPPLLVRRSVWAARVAAVALLVCLGATASANASPRPLTLGFVEPSLTDPAVSGDWLPRATAAGASAVRIGVNWAVIARTEPTNPTDPTDAAYDWSAVDSAVRTVTAAGMEPTLLATTAPTWAEGPNRPKTAQPGSWHPDAAAFGRFGQALARRYSGAYPDSARPGQSLPRVTNYQAWNEPNLDLYLAPQWQRRRGRWQTSGPAMYRAMLNRFYEGVKRADPSATVVTAGTAPFGDYQPGGHRLPPARFWRELLCLNAKLQRTCHDAVHFDVADHHPYSIGSPTQRALNSDDASIPDLRKITRPVAAGVRLGTALPRKPKPLWITEVSWDGNPPDPDGVPERTRARWLEQMLHLVWSEGASVVTWYLLRDQAPDPSYAATYQSGLYTRDGRPKLALQAFSFPIVTVDRRGSTVTAWGRSPAAGTLVLERRTGDIWRPITSLSVAAQQVFERRVAVPRGALVRARLGSSTSLPYKSP